MHKRIGFVVVTNGQPVRTGPTPHSVSTNRKKTGLSASETTRKGPKLYQHAGHARRVAKAKQQLYRTKVGVLHALINVSDTAEHFMIGYAVIGADGAPVKTGQRRNCERTAKLYAHIGKAQKVARERRASVHEVFI